MLKTSVQRRTMWSLYLVSSIIVGSALCYPSNIRDTSLLTRFGREVKRGLLREYQLNKTQTPTTGSKSDDVSRAYAHPGRFDNGDDETTDDYPHNICTCPDSLGWTEEQLNILKEDGQFSGGSSDCYCYNSSDYPNQVHQKLQSLKSGDQNIVLTGFEQHDRSRRQNHLVVTSLDGDIRELHLGPLHVMLN
ncbi:hypothetical protein C0J52_03280 [Blattella germanica]|nr:hypothetical protein C0J52_03280 [Blattella germanica]